MVEIIITAVVAALIQALGHYFNWRGVLGKPLPRLPAYAYGVLGIVLPLSALWALRGDLQGLGELWIVCGAAGGSVWACYRLDSWILMRQKLIEAEEREKLHDKGPAR